MTSNGKQLTVTREMLTAVARISARFSNFAFVLFCYITNHFFFPSNLNVSLDFVSGNIEILGKQNSLFPLGPVIKCLLLYLLVSMCAVIGQFSLNIYSFTT